MASPSVVRACSLYDTVKDIDPRATTSGESRAGHEREDAERAEETTDHLKEANRKGQDAVNDY